MSHKTNDLKEEIKDIEAAAKAASDQAIREAKALGLTIRIIEKGIVYDKHADGTKDEVAVMNNQSSLSLKAGTILHVKH